MLEEIGVNNIQQLDNYALILDGFDEISITDNRENDRIVRFDQKLS